VAPRRGSDPWVPHDPLTHRPSTRRSKV